jgi:hypothetical protein
MDLGEGGLGDNTRSLEDPESVAPFIRRGEDEPTLFGSGSKTAASPLDGLESRVAGSGDPAQASSVSHSTLLRTTRSQKLTSGRSETMETDRRRGRDHPGKFSIQAE